MSFFNCPNTKPFRYDGSCLDFRSTCLNNTTPLCKKVLNLCDHCPGSAGLSGELNMTQKINELSKQSSGSSTLILVLLVLNLIVLILILIGVIKLYLKQASQNLAVSADEEVPLQTVNTMIPEMSLSFQRLEDLTKEGNSRIITVNTNVENLLKQSKSLGNNFKELRMQAKQTFDQSTSKGKPQSREQLPDEDEEKFYSITPPE